MEKPVNKLFVLFQLMGLLLVGILLMGTYLYAALAANDTVLSAAVIWASVIGAAYCVGLNLVVGLLWRFVMKHHADYMTQFFTGASGLRFLSVMAVLGCCWAVVGRDAMAPYALVVFLYYIVNVCFHTFFFSHISNKLL